MRDDDITPGRGPTFMLASGRRIHPFNPSPDEIWLEDIAHGLAFTCRFAGHLSTFYSVAQHSVLVAVAVWNAFPMGTEEQAEAAFAALLHDASEGLGFCDLPGPIKHDSSMKGYCKAETAMQEAIWRKYGIPGHKTPLVKWADYSALATEMTQLLPTRTPPDGYNALDFTIEPLPPLEAKAEFLAYVERWRPGLCAFELDERKTHALIDAPVPLL